MADRYTQGYLSLVGLFTHAVCKGTQFPLPSPTLQPIIALPKLSARRLYRINECGWFGSDFLVVFNPETSIYTRDSRTRAYFTFSSLETSTSTRILHVQILLLQKENSLFVILKMLDCAQSICI